MRRLRADSPSQELIVIEQIEGEAKAFRFISRRTDLDVAERVLARARTRWSGERLIGPVHCRRRRPYSGPERLAPGARAQFDAHLNSPPVLPYNGSHQQSGKH